MSKFYTLLGVATACLILSACQPPQPQTPVAPAASPGPAPVAPAVTWPVMLTPVATLSPLPALPSQAATALPYTAAGTRSLACIARPDVPWRTWSVVSAPSAIFALQTMGNDLWAGTWRGVVRFTPRTGNHVLYGEMGGTPTLLTWGDGHLWASAAYGLFYFDGKQWINARPWSDQPIYNGPPKLGVDRNGDLWAQQYLGHRSYCYADLRFPGHTPPLAAPSGFGCYQSPANWGPTIDCQQWQAMTTGGYTHRSPSECEALNRARQAVDKITHESVMLAMDADQSIWWANQVELVHLVSGKMTKLALPPYSLHALAPDPVHGVWVATDKGLGYSDGKTMRWAALGIDACTFPDFPDDMAVDAQDTVWIISRAALWAMSPHETSWRTVVEFDLTSKEADASRRAVVAAPDGGIWATQGCHLWRFDGVSIAGKVRLPESLCSAGYLVVDPSGNVWVGSWERLARFTPASGEWREYAWPDQGSVLNVADSGGTLYVLGRRGLYSADVADAREWRLLASLPANVSQYSLAADQQGRMWIGSRELGELWRYQADGLIGFDQQFDVGKLRQLYADRAGRLWASLDDELAIRDGKTWQRIATPVGVIRKITGGPDGRIWVWGSQGIAVYDPANAK
jgi:ligand-binding sensor domain-containing protein